MGVFFGLIRSENSVPEDKRSTEILINVLGLRTVGDPVVRRRSEDEFNPAGQATNVFRMHPELKQHSNLICRKKIIGWKPTNATGKKKIVFRF